MKNKFLLCTIALILCLTSFSIPGFAANGPATNTATEARMQQIRSRLLEIKNMDMSKLSRDDRRALRHEVRELRQEAKDLDGGIYLSAGAIVIIILLLILIL